jgi:PPOX class probable F420-dependent enzyme
VIPEHLADFWSVPRLSTLGTVRADGSPHLVPVKCMRVGGEFHVLTRPGTVKARNLARNARASLAEHTSTLWATVEGVARIADDDATLAAARSYRERYGEPDTWGTCVMVLAPDRVLCGE